MQTTRALARLQSMVNYSGDPALTLANVTDLLNWSARSDADGNYPWSPKIVYDAATTATSTTITSASAGFVATDLGLLVQVEAAGTTGASLEGTVGAVVSVTQITGSQAAGATLTGAKLILDRPNPLWTPTYALEWAAAEGWRWKAAVAAERYKFQAAGGTFVRDQVFNHCLKMADEYQKRANNEPRSIRLMGNLVLDRLGYNSAIPWYYELLGN